MKNRLGQTIIKIIIIQIILFFSMMTCVHAKDGHLFSVHTDTDTQEVKPGGEITINVSVLGIYMGDEGINVLEGKINYDKTIFEKVTTSSIKNFDTWSTTYNDEGTTSDGKFLSASLSQNIKQDSKIFSITFKVKDDISEETRTQIEFENLTSNDGEDLINIGSKIVRLKIYIPKEPDKNENQDTDENQGADNGNSGTSKNQQAQVKDKSKTSQTMPYTGRSILISSIILINVLIVAILAIRNHKMKDVK